MTEGSTVTTTKYMGVYQYENNVLKFFPHAEGYVTKEGSTYRHVFTYSDHLGNIRLKYCDLNQNGSIETNEILEENHYYPFGLKHEGYNGDVLALANKYKYNGQEWQDELGLNWYTYRHRNYDPAIGRFMGIDPVSEEYFSISTFQFAHNNPVWKIEIEGLEGKPGNGEPDVINHEYVKVYSETYYAPNGKKMIVDVSVSSNLNERGPDTTQYVEGNSDSGNSLTYSPIFEPSKGLLCNIDATNEILMAHDVYQLTELASGVVGVAGVGKKMLKEVMDQVVKNGPESVSNLKGILKSAQSTIKGLDDQIADHSKKLDDYIKNPDAFDNKGFLKNASPELREKIINSRVQSLQNQIDNFKGQKEEISNGVQQILESIRK